MGKLRRGGNLIIHKEDWLTAADGTASATVSGYLGFKLIKVQTIPGLNGDLATTLPTDLYDISLTDEYSEAIVGTTLANRSGTASESVYPTVAVPILGDFTASITNGGATKTGRILFFFEKI